MFYILASTVFFLSTILLIISNSINIFPEIFFLSWLVQKGSIPYRDFFDDHGFLVHILLSPFTVDRTLIPLQFIYIFLHLVNLGLILAIIRKTGSKLSFVIGGILTVLLMHFFSENDFWFELFTTTFYLLAYTILLSKKFLAQHHIAGMLIGCATLVKPTAAFVLFPIFIVYKRVPLLIGFLFAMACAGMYLYINGAIPGLLDANFGYNAFLGKWYRPTYLQDAKLILTSFGIIMICLMLVLENKKLSQILTPIIFMGSSLIFLASGYTRVRMLPVVAFFPIIVTLAITLIRKKWKLPLLTIITIYIVIMTGKVYQLHIYLLSHRPPYISQQDGNDIVSYIKTNGINDSFFVLGNTVQPYYLLDQLPPTRIPLRYPLVERYYPDYEKRLIDDIRKNDVEYIFIPRPNEFTWNEIPAYLDTTYSLISKTSTLEVYRKNQ